MNVVDFQTKREAALQSCRARISDMRKLLRGLSSSSPHQAKIRNIIVRLEVKAAKLSSPSRNKNRNENGKENNKTNNGLANG